MVNWTFEETTEYGDKNYVLKIDVADEIADGVLDELKDPSRDDFDTMQELNWLFNEAPAMTGGMQGNSNLRLMRYEDLIQISAHDFYVKQWYHYRRAHDAKNADRYATNDVRNQNKLNLFGIWRYTGKVEKSVLRHNTILMVDGWFDDHDDLKRLYNVYKLAIPNPITRLRPDNTVVEFRPVKIADSWQAHNFFVTYQIGDNVGGDVETVACDRENISHALQWTLFNEYPVSQLVTVNQPNLLKPNEPTVFTRREYRPKRDIVILSQKKLDRDYGEAGF